MSAVKYVLAALLLSLIALVSYGVITTPDARTAHMVASGFDLRNFLREGDHIAFVYVLKNELRSPCLLRRATMIDTTLIIIRASK